MASIDRWPQRSQFKVRLDEWRLERDLTVRQAAAALGLTYNTLRQYTSPSRRDTKPSIELLQAAATLFNCRLTEFVDDPGEAIPGATSGASEVDRFVLRMIGHDLETLTEAETEAAFTAWKAVVTALRAGKKT